MKSALNLHSDAFLADYTVYRIDPDSGFPVISLKMRDDSEGLCPFVATEGCMLYEDRPTACRLYPLGRAVGKSMAQAQWEGFYFMLDSPGCLGIEEKTIWTVAQWQESQGLLPYLRMNDRMLHIVFHKERDRNKLLTERQLQKLLVSCYNLDVFREFVFNTRFLEVFEVDEKTRSRVKHDETALLDLGLAYLRETLF